MRFFDLYRAFDEINNLLNQVILKQIKFMPPFTMQGGHCKKFIIPGKDESILKNKTNEILGMLVVTRKDMLYFSHRFLCYNC